MADGFNAANIETVQLKLQQLIELNTTEKINKNGKTYLETDTILKLLAESINPHKSTRTTKTVHFIDSTQLQKQEEKNTDVDELTVKCDDDPNDESNKAQIKIDWTGYAVDHLRYEEDEKLQYYSNKDLFVILSKYLFIYSLPGNGKGEPRTFANKLSIIRILNKYDLVLIAAQQRDYTTKQYVKCLLPVSGWIYLPQSTIHKWINSDKLLNEKLSTRMDGSLSTINIDIDIVNIVDYNLSPKNGTNYKYINVDELFADQHEINELHDSLWKHLQNKDYKNIDFLGQEIAPFTHPLPQCIFKKDFDINSVADNGEHKTNDNVQPKKGKCFSTLLSLLNWVIGWMRVHPWCPMLLIVFIQAGIEVVIFSDIITDVIVIVQLYKVTTTSIGTSATLFFMTSVIFLISPYLIAWVATTQWLVRKVHNMQIQLSANKLNHIPLYWKVAVILFSIAPIGMLVLLLGDILHVLEYSVLRPLLYLLSVCIATDHKFLKLRVISFEELGYWKLRRVSEIFAESLPQSILQLLLLILLAQSNDGLAINVWSVVLALISSLIVTIFWCIVLIVESKKNGMNFVEYVTVVFQGSFKFVPYLPAIERGSKTGINVNWSQYRLDTDGLGLVAKAFITPSCNISTLKISMYTIENLHRLSCKYFGKTISQYNDEADNKRLELILSRQEQDINYLFEIFDIDQNQNFGFAEFARCCIVMRKDVARSVSSYNVCELFWDLIGADHANKNEIWLLDLLLKIRSSKQRISLLDYDHSLNFALKNHSLNLISLLIASNYHKLNEVEYKKCIIDSMLEPKHEKYTMALCEEEGVPIIVEILSADLHSNNGQTFNPFAVVSIPAINTEVKSYIIYNTNTPIWQNQYLLFIIPFNKIEQLLKPSNMSMFATTNFGFAAVESFKIPNPMIYPNDHNEDIDEDGKDDKNKENKSVEKRVRFEIEQSEANKSEVAPLDIDREYVSKLFAINRATTRRDNTYNTYTNLHNDHIPTTTLPMSQSMSTFRSLPINFDNVESNKFADLWEEQHHSESESMIKRSSFQILCINVKVENAKIDEGKYDDMTDGENNDEIIGGCKLKIDISQNIAKFHERIIEKKLHIRNKKRSIHNTHKYIVSGKLCVRVYLNALHKYLKYGLKYIDEHK